MKTFYSCLIVIFLVSNASYAQKRYSKENLEQASMKELDSLLASARTYNIIGLIATISGPVFIGTLYGLDAMNVNLDLGTVGAIFLLGTLTFIIGVPILIDNSFRIRRINEIKKSRSNNGLIEISPTLLYSNISATNSIGLCLRLKF